ncbi:MAG: nickel pincer cofactor biosynthesis protein LarC [Ignavibacteriales bacterium]|nr:nickel pincer cofactor biosynthesis protein LarC [Ignavibacteriales bacterium]
MEVAKAEAKVHNSTVEKIHFHEVGALDSIVDIVGAAICFESMGIESIYSSAVKLGSGGFVETEHGKLPLPGPATLEILRGYPTVLTDIPFELTTPTGAAIIKAMSEGILSSERITVESIGYGAGTREIPQIPNVLRVMIGELVPAYDQDEVVIIETNIDDMNPEIYPFVIEQLLARGAHDAYLVPIIMKKGRPGILLSVLVSRSKIDEILAIIFSQTTTLGVRIQPVERRKLKRNQREVQTRLGKITVKVVVHDGTERLLPEYEECKKIALQKNIPLMEVYRLLEQEISSSG